MTPKQNKSHGAGPVVLDASAMLAVLRREPGAEVVEQHLRGAKMSAVNCAEVLQKSSAMGVSETAILGIVDDLEVHIVDFTLEHARVCTSLLEATRSLGLSLGDRACLGLGIVEQTLVLTADKDWDNPVVTAKIKLIR